MRFCHEGVLALSMKPGVSMIVRFGQYAYSARSTIGFADTVPAQTFHWDHITCCTAFTMTTQASQLCMIEEGCQDASA